MRSQSRHANAHVVSGPRLWSRYPWSRRWALIHLDPQKSLTPDFLPNQPHATTLCPCPRSRPRPRLLPSPTTQAHRHRALRFASSLTTTRIVAPASFVSPLLLSYRSLHVHDQLTATSIPKKEPHTAPYGHPPRVDRCTAVLALIACRCPLRLRRSSVSTPPFTAARSPTQTYQPSPPFLPVLSAPTLLRTV
jgi:hypothetical protein